MKQNLRANVMSVLVAVGTRVGAVILAIATMAAIVFALLNFDQRARFESPDDGVSWKDTDRGVEAWQVVVNSPAQKAGIRVGDRLIEFNDASIGNSLQVTKKLWRAGLWTQVRYKLVRNGEEFETPLVTAPADKPASIENYLRFAGLLYLFIGFFILWKRWNAPRAVHFYIFCLVSFIFCSFHYSGKLDAFDYEVYWAGIMARLLAPALLLHFALVFPERTEPTSRSLRNWVLVYSTPLVLLTVHFFVASGNWGFIPWIGARVLLDKIELGYFGACYLATGLVFYFSYKNAPSGVLRQQLKWLMGGTFVGTVPCVLLYILPFVVGLPLAFWMKFSVLSLVLIPLCFGYAIIRYRLMDVDIIFKRGLAYTAATAGVLVVFFALIGLIGLVFHTQANGKWGGVLAIVIAASIFEPCRQWFQGRLDRFFYRDRLDYRRTLIEFGSALTNEVRLDPMLSSVMDRVSQTLLVDRIAVFVEDTEQPGQMRLARSMGVRTSEPLDLSFIEPNRPEFAAGALFYESARVADVNDSVRRTLEQLDLNYFVPCRIREQTVAVLGLGKTVDGDFLSSDDVELVTTIGGYVAVALDNAQLYSSLEQKALEIARLKDFSENIVESLNIGVLAVDLTGIVESWNTRMEQLFGVTRQEAVGRKLDSLLPKELATEILTRSEEEQVTGIYKQRLQHQGKSLTMNVSITPLVSKSGERIGRLLLFDDVTQRERMEEQMTQTEKLTSLGLLAAGVAHEVNTPLAVISNYIQMLAKQMPEEDPRHSIIEKIVKQTFRASEIVNNLLNFSRTGAAELVNVDVNKVVEETLSLVAHPMKTSQIQVVKNLGDSLPSVRGSANKLQQVFLNLFLNARDAMPSGGMLEVKTLAHNGSVEIEIVDTGAGIPREHIHKIFDPFFTTKATGRGTGLGLSVSYGIIKEHAGKIDVRSTPGKGTSFHVEFPAVRKPVHV
ncbi:MAG TPA: ATP-binding protein [Candidatus Dormibacteraeota bacterium]|jgi:two-component system NtrC family sensor kinase|nr:ATP-binding protein [Candidatus Dormibacteraeota bacterium]